MILLVAACGMPEPAPLPPGSFAFGVFGDGPYQIIQTARFRRLLRDVGRSDLQWFLHIGDILWLPCSNQAYTKRLKDFNSLPLPVIYTPGDNEWTDCHETNYRPLERLEQIRKTFFAGPGTTLGARAMRVQTQHDDPAYAEFVENVRWRYGGFLFATIHMVGSSNASKRFRGRAAEDDAEVTRRTRAAMVWMEAAFATATADGAKGIVLALHGNPDLGRLHGGKHAYSDFVNRLDQLVRAFPGQVLLIHGDTHIYRVDHPLKNRETGDTLQNFTRLETFGSPDIGWVRVVVDSVNGRIQRYEPRLMPWWWLL